MSLSLAEFQIRKRLPRRSSILLFDAACLLGWTTERAIADLAGVSRRRAELELVELVRNGWLVREKDAPRHKPGLVRFRAAVRTIADDRSGTIVPDPSRTIADDHSPTRRTRARVGAPPDLSDPMDQRVRPSEGVQGGTDARTDIEELRGSDVQWICEQWTVSGAIAHQMLLRLRDLGLSRRELREYLAAAKRGSHSAFAGLERAAYPLGAACTRERVEPWRASRARPRPPVDVERRPRRHEVSAVSAREMEDFVRSKLR